MINHNIGAKPGILQVLPSLMSGSTERQVIQLAELISKNNYNAFVCSSGGIMVSQLYQMKARHIDLPFDTKNPYTLWRNISRLVDVIQKHNIKLIHAQSVAPAWSAYLAAKKTGCQFITTVHETYDVSTKFNKLYNSVITKGSKVIAVSYYIEDYLRQNYEFDTKKIEVVHGGINLNYFNFENIEDRRIVELAQKIRIPTDKPIILVPGKLTRTKGHEFIIKTIKQLEPNSVTCLIVGSDKGNFEYRQELQNLIDNYGLSKRIIITSNINDMPAMYALSDIVIASSSKPEAFGMVSTEAQAMGRMVIATNSGGAKETIIDGQTGCLVSFGDVNALKNAIHEALSLELPQRLYRAKLARNHVERHFSLERMQEKMLHIYRCLINSKY